MPLAAAGLLLLAAGALAAWPGDAGRALWWLGGAPLAEELVFRAGLQTLLARRIGAVAAVLASSLLFAAAHVALSPSPVAALTFLPSLALGAVYAASGRLRDAVALHALFNALWMVGGNAALSVPTR